jgi:hypothetical protein
VGSSTHRPHTAQLPLHHHTLPSLSITTTEHCTHCCTGLRPNRHRTIPASPTATQGIRSPSPCRSTCPDGEEIHHSTTNKEARETRIMGQHHKSVRIGTSRRERFRAREKQRVQTMCRGMACRPLRVESVRTHKTISSHDVCQPECVHREIGPKRALTER